MTSPEPPGGTLTALRVRGDVEFDRVSFAYHAVADVHEAAPP